MGIKTRNVIVFRMETTLNQVVDQAFDSCHEISDIVEEAKEKLRRDWAKSIVGHAGARRSATIGPPTEAQASNQWANQRQPKNHVLEAIQKSVRKFLRGAQKTLRRGMIALRGDSH